MNSFPALKSWHTNTHSGPNRVKNGCIRGWKSGYILQKKSVLKLNWEGEGRLFGNGFVDVLTI